LVNSVANVLGCQALRLGQVEDGAGELMSIVGFPGDLSLVETLVTSLFVQLTTAMTAPDALSGRTASQVAAWRRSFIMGFTETVAERLAADRRRVADDADAQAPAAGQTSTAIVLRDRSSAVDADFRRRYPRIRTARVSAGTSAAGRRAGTSAGRSADLGNRRLSTRHALRSGR
jgi:hypothetical protein